MTRVLLNIEKEDDLKLILALAKRLGLEHQVSLNEEEMEFYQGLSSAYEEVKLMVDGKREKKSLKTFLDE
ncbi:hypothetical protein [Phaeodactylibacter xiamenensis]|uniref:hypothetical protein n=1 Tax=Phaeodactylibacter xiamenensis TaxID=1524460 RepID=UPI0024A98E9A|nr:hypothetical protein [Phaeodactylibacter xiamenensis]